MTPQSLLFLQLISSDSKISSANTALKCDNSLPNIIQAFDKGDICILEPNYQTLPQNVSRMIHIRSVKRNQIIKTNLISGASIPALNSFMLTVDIWVFFIACGLSISLPADTYKIIKVNNSGSLQITISCSLSTLLWSKIAACAYTRPYCNKRNT